MNIEDLMNIEVTSVAKKEQKVSRTAAAVFVITREDIRRSGATNIPELLRMVPGLDVARINSNTWAISSRGFNSQFSNKLLILVDGRAVYTPTLGGVYWETVDMPLEDIDRIEVIRGPGGTIWGANAVNGVINVITQKASDASGALVSGGGGTQDQAFGTLQYGGKISRLSYRVFAKYTDDDHSPDFSGQNGMDAWHLLHGGFRVDSPVSNNDALTIQGDIYAGSEGATVVHTVLSPPENINVTRIADLSGGNVLGRWTHTFSGRSDIALQVYFDNYTRSGPESREERNTFDFDFQHHLSLGTRHDLIWGAEFRSSPDHTVGTIDQAWIPADRTFNLFSAFFQDEVTLKPDRLFLTLGSKIEQTDFAGFNVAPSIRLAYTLQTNHTLWAAVSTASRTPSRRDLNLNAALAAFPGPTEVLLVGNPQMQSERVLAYEAGYRMQLTGRLSVDTSLFLNSYWNLETIESRPTFVAAGSEPPLTVNPLGIGNEVFGTSGGVEVSASWKATRRWTLSPGYSYLKIKLHTDPNSAADAQGSAPAHQAQLRSRFELTHSIIWDASAYFVGNLPDQLVTSYTRLDSQLSWRVGESSEFAVVGQNLLRDTHPEFNGALQVVNSTLVKRSAYAKFTFRF